MKAVNSQLNTKSAAAQEAQPDADLAALERRLARDLACLNLPAAPWVAPGAIDGEPLLDVAVIGAGMAGLAAATALRNLGIVARVYDRAEAGYEGPWATTARMETLRSPKWLVGPALGLPALTFRAWYEAQFGARAWQALDKIPRLQWMDYLRWYRRVMQIDVHNRHRVSAIRPHADYVELQMHTPAGARCVRARHVVLATGRDGLGGPRVPDFVDGIDPALWAHSSARMDYATLRGLRVGVIGGGSSAMDSAATALEQGAQHVDLLVRRADFPRVNKSKGAGSAGYVYGYPALPDDWKWRIRHYIEARQVPPPHHSVLRVSAHDNVAFNMGQPIRRVTQQGDTLRVHTPQQVFEFDFLILATGFKVDWAARPEFAAFASHVRSWADRLQPEQGAESGLLDFPDLGPAFEFQARRPGSLPGLEAIHSFCHPAAMTHGAVSGDIPAVGDGAQRLARGIARQLFTANIDQHFSTLEAYADPELLGDEWTPAPVPDEKAAQG